MDAAERPERRVVPLTMRISVAAIIHEQASASGGKVSPDASASTSWLAFSDQFQRR
jgi:hypothetical protein